MNLTARRTRPNVTPRRPRTRHQARPVQLADAGRASALRAIDTRIKGRLVVAGDPGWDQVEQAWNFERPPLAVALVTSVDDALSARSQGADGSGLVRTEILFGHDASMPSVETQVAAFTAVAEAFEGLPITIRTWDVGGDKPLPFLPQPAEANPFLGERGLRLVRRAPEVLQAQLREIGIALELRRLDWAAHLKLVDDGTAGFYRQGWIADYPDPENFLTVLFHSRNAGAAGNTSRYRNPRVDRLLDEADAMPAGPERDRRYQEAERLIVNDAVWVSLHHYASRTLVKSYVRGLERSPQSTAPEILGPFRKVWFER